MFLKLRRQFLPVVTVVALASVLLGLALYFIAAPRALAAVKPVSGPGTGAMLNPAICVVAQTTGSPYLAAELVETECPREMNVPIGALLVGSTQWIELDLSGQKISSTFAPAAGELDGLLPGARIDLSGTGVNQNEIDLSAAIGEGTALCHVLYGDPGAGNSPCKGTAPSGPNVPRSLTFLLDRGDDETGLGNLPTAVDEGGILYIPFQFGQRPRGLNFPVESGVTCSGLPPGAMCIGSSLEGERGSGDTVERFVAFEITIEHKGLDFERTAYAMTSSRDPDDTLYVVPILMGDDSVIDDNENAVIEVIGVQVGLNQGGDLSTPNVNQNADRDTNPAGFDLGYLYQRDAILDGYDKDFEKDLSTARDTVLVKDEDSPRYPVCERHPQVIAAIETELSGEKCRRISLDSLGTINELAVYPGAPDVDDPLEEIFYSDLEGLTGLTFLDLAGNDLRDLPANAFRDVGVGKPNEIALIDLRFNLGRRSANDGFLPTDVSSSVRSNLQNRQVLRVDTPARDVPALPDRFPRIYESAVIVFDVHVDSGYPEITFVTNNGGDQCANEDPVELIECTAEVSDLPQEISFQGNLNAGSGTYVVAIRFPFESLGDGDDEDEIFEVVLSDGSEEISRKRLTIVDVDNERSRTISTSSRVYQPPRRPTSRPTPDDRPSFDYPTFVIDNQYEVAPNNPDLRHNIPDLSVNIDGRTVIAGFLSHYRNTGGRERWGYPTSEVLVLEDGTLTQFYQRGAVDFHNIVGWIVERRLAWDYVGGGLGRSVDQGFESGPFNPNPGILLGPWGNRVSNVSIEGTNVGFADSFDRLGGVTAFGVPKTEARFDIVSSGRLLGPDLTPGFIRQYFQAAVFEYHPNDPEPVKLALLGDTLRDALVPGHTRERAFAAAGRLVDGASYTPPVVD